MADADTVRHMQPGPQIAQLRVRRGRQLCSQGVAEWLKPKWHMVVLWAGRGLAQLAQPRTDFGDVGLADAEAGRQLSQCRVRVGQDPVAQILPISLPRSPPHPTLQ